MLLTLVLVAATAQLAPGAWIDSPAPVLAAPTALPPVEDPVEDTVEGTFTQRLTALELALSMLVTETPASWRFEALRREADALRSLAGTEAEKAQLQGLTSRLEKFSRLARRFRQSDEQLAGWRAAGATRGDARDTLAPRTAPGPSSTAGVLRPVVSQRPDAPKYAVIDDNGQIAALVTPTPALEAQLRGMVGRRVGVEGQRDFRSDLRRDHVVAERVTPLDTLRR